MLLQTQKWHGERVYSDIMQSWILKLGWFTSHKTNNAPIVLEYHEYFY